jgi:hypothetical protein
MCGCATGATSMLCWGNGERGGLENRLPFHKGAQVRSPFLAYLPHRPLDRNALLCNLPHRATAPNTKTGPTTNVVETIQAARPSFSSRFKSRRTPDGCHAPPLGASMRGALSPAAIAPLGRRTEPYGFAEAVCAEGDSERGFALAGPERLRGRRGCNTSAPRASTDAVSGSRVPTPFL